MISRQDALEWAIERDFRIKTGFLIIGFVLIWIGSQLENPKLGFLVSLGGILLDWGIVYLVYVEMSTIKSDIETIFDSTFSNISKSQGGIKSLEDRLEEVIGDIEYEVLSGKAGTLSYDVSDLEKRVDELEELDDEITGSNGLKRQIDDLDKKLKQLERGLL